MKDMIKGNLTQENKMIATRRNMNIKICLKCHAHNSIRARRCRKCGYQGLRLKSKQTDKKRE